MSLPISKLPEIIYTEDTDVIPIVQNGVTSKIQMNDIPRPHLIKYGNYTDQEIVADSDDWQQITFGNLSDVGDADVGAVLKPTGDLELTKIGYYRIDIKLQLSRQGTGGQGGNTVIGIVMRVGGPGLEIQGSRDIGNVYSINLPNFQSMDTLEFSYVHRIRRNDFQEPTPENWQLLMTRSSALSTGAGVTQGGLYNIEIGNPITTGLSNQSTSAKITVTKL